MFFIFLPGTCKIGRNCTAATKVTCDKTGEVVADINYTHYGHEKELEHVWIPKGKRQEIAAKGRYCIRESVNGTFSHHHLIDTTEQI